MVWLRSFVFQVYFFVSVCLAALTIFVGFFLPYRVRFGIARLWARSMLAAGKLLCGMDYVFEGCENIPAEPCVVMMKHTTVFEAYAQLVAFPPQAWVVKRELLWIPFFGWGLAAMKPIAINRGAGHSAVKQVIDRGKSLLAEGVWVTIFPEGTRVAAGETRRYGISGAALAKEAQCPIVPVAQNAGDLWSRRSLKKRPGLVRFCIGPAIYPADRSAKEINELVQGWVETKMSEISTAYADK